jgi:plasmid stabilization system protein ParE
LTRLAIIVGDRSARQIEEASDWWRAHRVDSPEALADELEHAFELISRQPGVGLPAQGTRLRGVRRVLLRRVGYLLYYRVAPGKDELHVLAFRHARRGTDPGL